MENIYYPSDLIIKVDIKLIFFFFLIFLLIQSDSVGWSDRFQFRTPPAGGSDELNFLVYGDMGKAPRDASVEHYIQVRLTLLGRMHVGQSKR
jgi:hypothetical protein